MHFQRVAKTSQTDHQKNTQNQSRSKEPNQESLNPILQLQRTIGNRAVGRLLQAKLAIGQPNDKYEQEADRVAEEVMRMPVADPVGNSRAKTGVTVSHPPRISRIQRVCPECEKEMRRQPADEEEEPVQTKSNSSVVSNIQRLKEREKEEEEPIRGKSDSPDIPRIQRLKEREKDENLKTNDVAFGERQYSPDTTEGKKLLAHELTHVMQQFQGGSNNSRTMQTRMNDQFSGNILRHEKKVPIIQRQVEESPGNAINVIYSVPLGKTDIQASPGERMIFGVEASDRDRRRPVTGGAWTPYQGVGPYEMKFAVAGDAEFNSAGSGVTDVVRHSLSSGNVNLIIKNSWTGASRITVTATIKDKIPNSAAPNTGSAKDPDVTITWTIKKRTNPCPTGLRRVGGPGAVWTAAPAVYAYQATPDRPPAGRPDYEKQTVLESFGTVTALGFTMSDLNDAWKSANPTLNTPNKVAAFLWDAGGNGTFVFDNHDRIYDQHAGFGTLSPFKASAFTDADGVGYRLPQTYTCGGTNIGNATIDRRYTTANGIEIKKTGP